VQGLTGLGASTMGVNSPTASSDDTLNESPTSTN
jgi:hypothetical protein